MSEAVLGTAKVIKGYESRSKDGLSLTLGGSIEVLNMDDSFWWLGRDEGGKTGLFPSNRVELIKRRSALPVSPRKPQVRQCVGIYQFQSTSADDLSFEPGDIIEVLNKDKSGWWKGRIGNREGLFPANRTRPLVSTADIPTEDRDSASSSASATTTTTTTAAAVVSPASPPPTKLPEAPEETTAPPVEEADRKQGNVVSIPLGSTQQQKDFPKTPTLSSRPDDKKPVANNNVEDKGTSPRRALQGMLNKLKRGKSEKKELDIEHPFEQEDSSASSSNSQLDHLKLLDKVDTTASTGPKAAEDPATLQKKRHGYILMELVDTEQDYVRDMEMIVELFLVPLRITKIISKAEADDVFQNLPHLIPINKDFLEKLKVQAALPIEQQRVGAAFSSFAVESLKEYTQYASQSQLSGRTLLNLSKTNPQWARFLEETYRNPQLRDLKLDTYLIKPVQRVCRYPLLLHELQKVTPPHCQDSKDLLQAIESLNSVIAEINETRRESEKLHHVVEIENSLRGLPPDVKLVVPGRTFVREAMMEEVRKGRRKKTRFVWMFSDCIVLGKQAVRSIQFSSVVYFKLALLQNVVDTTEIEHAFELILVDQKKSIVLCCSSKAQKQEWVADITAIIERNLEEAGKEHKRDRSVKNLTGGASASGSAALGDSSGTIQSLKPLPTTAVPSSSVSFDSSAGLPAQKKVSSPPVLVLGKGSVRVKGPGRTQRVMKLRDEMTDANSGLELANVQSIDGKVFAGRAAIDWCVNRFNLDNRQPAVELMVGLLRSGVIFPVLDTPAEDFIDAFTAFYQFADL